MNLGEYHTGYRAFSREALETIPWENNSNDFVFDQEILIQATVSKIKIAEIPVPAKYFNEASSIGFFRRAWTKYPLSQKLKNSLKLGHYK